MELSKKEIGEAYEFMLPSERLEFDALIGGYEPLFKPNPGPQQMAFDSPADIVGFGGAAGGGKSMLGAGEVTTKQRRSLIIRQEKVTTAKFVQEITKMCGGERDGYSQQASAWRFTGPDGVPRFIAFAGLDNEGDEEKQQGVDYDYKLYDEVTQMREAQVRYTMGWVRTDLPDVKCKVLMCFNPPTTAEGRWVIKFFGPWLDPTYPGERAKDGELRWFITKGEDPDFEVPDERAFVWQGATLENPDGDGSYEMVYDFDPAAFEGEAAILVIKPKSRTFIRSLVTDNPYYLRSGYISQLQSLPEPLRSQMLRGDFGAGIEDNAWQVIPSAWIEAAMDRWNEHQARGLPIGEMDTLGVDAARGGNMGSTRGAVGRDKMTIAPRHGRWFAPVISIKGVDANSGALAASHVIQHRRNNAPVHIDIIGVGTSPYDFLQQNNIHTIPINGAAACDNKDRSGLLGFVNLRAYLYWALREALDPTLPDDQALMIPDDMDLLADLTAPTFEVTKSGIKVESKDEIKKRLKRSPDKGDCVVYANVSTPKIVMAPSGFAGVHIPQMSWEEQRLKDLE